MINIPKIGEAFGGGYLAALMPAPNGRQFALIGNETFREYAATGWVLSRPKMSGWGE